MMLSRTQVPYMPSEHQETADWAVLHHTPFLTQATHATHMEPQKKEPLFPNVISYALRDKLGFYISVLTKALPGCHD